MEAMEPTDQTFGEEIANSISHGMGAALCIAGMVLLTMRAARWGGPRAMLCVAVFGASAVLLYLNSTLYHSMSHTKAYPVLRSMDHGSIYLLIAGTYTPVSLIGLGGVLGWTIFGIVWSCALVGVIVKTFATGRWEALSTAAYLVMGYICVFAIRSVYALLSHPVFALIMAGGVFYSAGIPFFASKKKYMHFIWHLFVLGGTICHFAAVWLMLR